MLAALPRVPDVDVVGGFGSANALAELQRLAPQADVLVDFTTGKAAPELLVADDIDPADLRADPKNALPKLHGALLKNEQDVHLFERLAFMARRQ